MSESENKALVRAYPEDVWKKHDLDAIVRIAGGRFVDHWGERDTAGLLEQLRG